MPTVQTIRDSNPSVPVRFTVECHDPSVSGPACTRHPADGCNGCSGYAGRVTVTTGRNSRLVVFRECGELAADVNLDHVRALLAAHDAEMD